MGFVLIAVFGYQAYSASRVDQARSQGAEAWGGIGMATRGSVPRIMEMAGVEMLPAAAGVAWIRRELTAHAFRGEVVVATAARKKLLVREKESTRLRDQLSAESPVLPFGGRSVVRKTKR